MNTELSGQEFNSMFDELLDDVVRGSVEQEIQERQTYEYETLNGDYVESIELLITDLLMEEETDEQDDQEVTDNENDVHEHQFTIIMGTSNEEMISQFELATNELLLDLVEPEQVDVVIFHLLSEQEQERVINHNVARLSFEDLQSMVQEFERMWAGNEVSGVSVEQYLQQDLSEGIPTEVEVEPEPVEESLSQ